MDVCFKVNEISLNYPHVSPSGSNGRSVPLSVVEPDQWQATVNRFWQYITDLNKQTDGVVKTLKTHQISRELE